MLFQSTTCLQNHGYSIKLDVLGLGIDAVETYETLIIYGGIRLCIHS